MSGLLSWERIGVEGRAVSSAGIKDYQTTNDGHELLAAVMKMMNSTEETHSLFLLLYSRGRSPFPISSLDAMPCHISPNTLSATAMTI